MVPPAPPVVYCPKPSAAKTKDAKQNNETTMNPATKNAFLILIPSKKQ